jgi:hypothetical protein
MSTDTDTVGQLKNRVEQTAARAARHPLVESMARFGYVVRGVLYVIIGLLALAVAFGHGGETTDKAGAIATIGAEPFGKLLLVLIAAGLVGYSLWGFIRAFLDPLHRGTDPKGIAVRVGYFVSGLTYGALVIPTWRYIMGSGSGAQGGPGASQDLTAQLLAQPWGPWVLALIGLIGMGGGLGQIYQGLKADFKKDFKTEEMNPNELRMGTLAGQIGMTARGVVFTMIGFFVFQAALNVDPKKVQGVDGALQTLARQPYGPWLMGAVAAGLVAFGFYSIMCARWMRVFRS